ncbi:beta-N-acetylhexosaminidase [Thalassotalea ganghwensis]
MIDVEGTSLTQEDKELLNHPLVGGVILFSRNYQSPQQISALTDDIRTSVNGNILIAVDHEGGRVQRFREGFSAIPAMGKIYQLASANIEQAAVMAKQAGTLMALEVQSVGIDISFAPVLDINNISAVIGDRSFHQQPDIVAMLAHHFINGMKSVGMQATGKHFPGHGSVKADSHIAMAIDERSYQAIEKVDMQPFKQLIADNQLAAIMPAHVIYPDVDDKSVGFSRIWLQDILRNRLGFDGVIFSDDLSMHGASSIGGFIERAEAAQEAGCDMLLMCNNRLAVFEVIDNANLVTCGYGEQRIAKMLKTSLSTWQDMKQMPLWQSLNQEISNW